MLNIQIDDRSNHRGSGICATCCCAPIALRAGETSLLTLDYSAWAVPIMAMGGPGLVPTPEIFIVENADACNNSSIDGFGPPQTTNAFFVVPQEIAINTPLTYDLTDDVEPSDNVFEFELVPVAGPMYGTITAMPASGASWTYEPNTGFVGYDQFWVAIKDAQGRKIIRPVNIKVGAATGIPPFGWGEKAAMGVQVDRSKMKINSQMQTISFPVYLPPSNDAGTIDACRHYRATIKAYASNCDDTFTHLTCVDFRTGGC